MKHIKIVLALLITVLISMGGVFLVEGFTTPIIEERLEAQANEALLAMFDGSDSVANISDTMPEDDLITTVYSVLKGSQQVGVVYKASFAGYNPGVIALLGVSTEDNTVAGFSVLANADTAGLGKDLLEDPAFSAQFAGLTIEQLRADGVDFVSGSTAAVTLGGVNRAVQNILIYHGVNFLGEEAPIIETPEMIKERVQSEWFPGATFTDVTSDVEVSDGINQVLEASDGGILIEATFNGYAQVHDPASEDSVYVIGFKDGKVVGYETLSSTETMGIGYDLVFDAAFGAQMVGVDAESLLDTGADFVSGATAAITLAAVNESLTASVGHYVVNYLGGEAPVVEDPMDKYLRLLDEWVSASADDVTADYPSNTYVTGIYTDGSDKYFVEAAFDGYHPDTIYILGFDGMTIQGYAVIQTSESPGLGKDLLEDEAFEAQLTNVSVETILETEVDFVSGSTAGVTLAGFNESLTSILKWYQAEVQGIQDEEAPVISVLSGFPTEFAVGATAPNWSAYVEVHDNDAVASVTNTGDEVDFATAGDYDVVYTATDKSGNIATETITITIVAGEVELEIIPPGHDTLIVLQGLYTSTYYHKEPIASTDHIVSIFTARDDNKDAVQVFYEITSSNGGFGGNNITIVMFDINTSTITGVEVVVDESSYEGTSYENNGDSGPAFGDVDFSFLIGLSVPSTYTGDTIDSAAGTSTMETMNQFVEALDEAINYQITNNIGGTN